MIPDWTRSLAALLGPGVLEVDPDVVASYSRDQAALAPAGTALALVKARSVDQISTTLRFANEHKIPVVTRAAGTGLAGGANAVDGAILLSVLALDRIVQIDTQARTAIVEPGVLNGKLASEAAARGLFYAPDPASREISTIGGNIATNAGGACCLKYGVTGDHVLALKAVTADGTLIHAGCASRKNVAGLDLMRLLIGSEGTLAVIVEATLRLLRKPRPASTLLAFFDTLTDAAAAIVAMGAELDLSLIEVMDQTTIKAVDQLTKMQLDTTAAALVVVQSDAADASATVARAEALCHQHAAREVMCTDNLEEGRMLLAARRMALPALEKLGATLLDDVAVPTPALAEMFARCAKAAQNHGVVIGTFGHAGDGNLHPTIVFDQQNEASVSAAYRAFDEIVQAALALGGTITGEHGVGSLKAGYVEQMIGATERQLMRGIKSIFDPSGILNPGKAY